MTCILQRQRSKARRAPGSEFMSHFCYGLCDLIFPLNKLSSLGEAQGLQACSAWLDPDPSHVLCDLDSVLFSNWIWRPLNWVSPWWFATGRTPPTKAVSRFSYLPVIWLASSGRGSLSFLSSEINWELNYFAVPGFFASAFSAELFCSMEK